MSDVNVITGKAVKESKQFYSLLLVARISRCKVGSVDTSSATQEEGMALHSGTSCSPDEALSWVDCGIFTEQTTPRAPV